MKMRRHAFHQYRFVFTSTLYITILLPFFLILLCLHLWGFVLLLLGMCSSGETTLSASGMLVPDTLFDDTQVAKLLYGDNSEGRVLVLTVASVVEPFLSPQHRHSIPQVAPHAFPTNFLFFYIY